MPGSRNNYKLLLFTSSVFNLDLLPELSASQYQSVYNLRAIYHQPGQRTYVVDVDAELAVHPLSVLTKDVVSSVQIGFDESYEPDKLDEGTRVNLQCICPVDGQTWEQFWEAHKWRNQQI